MNSNNKESLASDNFYLLVRKNSLYIFIERSAVPVINFLITVYVVRKLTVNDYGIYNVLLAIMGYVTLFSSCGIPSVFQRFIPEFCQKKQIGNLSKLVKHGSLWMFIVSIGIILIMILFSNHIGRLFKFGDALHYLIIFAIAIIFSLQSDLLAITLTSVFHHRTYVTAQISYVIFRGVFLYYMLSKGKGLTGLLIVEAAAFVFLFVIQFVFYQKFLAANIAREIAEFPFKRLIRFGGYSYLNELGAQILAVTTDFFVISAFLGPAVVGIYAFANRIMSTISHILPHHVLTTVIRPAFFSKVTECKSPQQINKMFNLLVKIIAFFVFPLVVGTIVLGDKLIMYVYDPKYLESLTVLWIVAVFTALNFFMFPIGLVLQSLEKVQILFYSKIFAVYNLVADILLIKPYGLVGVALATGSAIFFKNIFCYLFARKYTRLDADLRNLGIIFFNSLLMGLLVYAVRGFVVNTPTFILVTIIGCVIYLILAHFNRAFLKEERKIINKILPKPVFVF